MNEWQMVAAHDYFSRLVIESAPAFQASEATATRSCRYRRELGLPDCAICSSPGMQLVRIGFAKTSKMRISDSRCALRLAEPREGERDGGTPRAFPSRLWPREQDRERGDAPPGGKKNLAPEPTEPDHTNHLQASRVHRLLIYNVGLGF